MGLGGGSWRGSSSGRDGRAAPAIRRGGRSSLRRSGSPEASCGQQIDRFIDLGALQVVEEGGDADADGKRHSFEAVPGGNDLLQRLPQEPALGERLPGRQAKSTRR